MARCSVCNNPVEDGVRICAVCAQKMDQVTNFFNGIRSNLNILEQKGYVVKTEIRRSENSVLYIATNADDQTYAFRKFSFPAEEGSVEERVKSEIREIADINQNEQNRFVITYYDYAMEQAEGDRYDLYIRMDYLTSLRQYSEEAVMTVRDLLRMGIDVCNALDGCHKSGRIHGHLRQDSIYLNQNGTYVLGDFDLFGNMDCPDAGQQTEGDTLSDICSLGQILAEMLCQQNVAVTDIREALPRWVNHRLKEVILKAVTYGKKGYDTADAMGRDLQNLLKNMSSDLLDRPLKPEQSLKPVTAAQPAAEPADDPEESLRKRQELWEHLKKSNWKDMIILGCLIVGLIAAMVLTISIFYNTSNNAVYTLIKNEDYAMALKEITEIHGKGKNVDELARAYIDSCVADGEYKRVVPAVTLFSEEGYADAAWFEGLIERMIAAGNVYQAEAIMDALYSVETLRPMLDGIVLEK